MTDQQLINEIFGLPHKILLEQTENKCFFNEKEFKQNYGKLMVLAGLKNQLEKRLTNIPEL